MVENSLAYAYGLSLVQKELAPNFSDDGIQYSVLAWSVEADLNELEQSSCQHLESIHPYKLHKLFKLNGIR